MNTSSFASPFSCRTASPSILQYRSYPSRVNAANGSRGPCDCIQKQVERMDYTRLQQLYSAKGRISSIPPHILFKVIIFIPSHMTFQRFFARLTVPVAKDLFAQLIREPATLDSITFQEVFIDGTKREANANRYTFVWRKAVGNQIDDLSTRNNSPYWAPETVIPKRTRMQLSCA